MVPRRCCPIMPKLLSGKCAGHRRRLALLPTPEASNNCIIILYSAAALAFVAYESPKVRLRPAACMLREIACKLGGGILTCRLCAEPPSRRGRKCRKCRPAPEHRGGGALRHRPSAIFNDSSPHHRAAMARRNSNARFEKPAVVGSGDGLAAARLRAFCMSAVSGEWLAWRPAW